MIDERIVVGVMIPPWANRAFHRWQEWEKKFDGFGIELQYVVGHHEGREPQFPHRYLDARENLQHVGKVTEKSAAFWLDSGDESWRCKSDDDTLVHMARLRQTLRGLDPSVPTYFGHIKWRGWEMRGFRACGGVWGTAENVWTAFNDGSCPMASGPFPYAVGAFQCMSRAAIRTLQKDDAFRQFVLEARRRNANGSPCATASACANASPETRMWHHEDAGIAANLFRAIARSNTSLRVVATPGHFNDPFAIEMSPAPNDILWSSRALWVHGIKRHHLFNQAVKHWNLSRTMRLPELVCRKPSEDPKSRWRSARWDCGAEKFCRFAPDDHVRICRWPWRAADP